MPCQLPVEIATVTDDVFSYMCNLAMEKCSKKADKKKASCGGAAMRKRLLIKNFVAQMLAQDRQSRELSSPTSNCSSHSDQYFDESFNISSSSNGSDENVDCSSHSNQIFDDSFNNQSCQSGSNGSDECCDEMEMDDFWDAVEQQKIQVPSDAVGGPNDFLSSSPLLTDLDDISCDKQHRSRKRPWSLVFSADCDNVLMPSPIGVVDHNNVFASAIAEQQHHSHFVSTHPTSLLSPLCCGMLQMSPFEAAATAEEAMLISGAGGGGRIAAQQQPMLKRVKL